MVFNRGNEKKKVAQELALFDLVPVGAELEWNDTDADIHLLKEWLGFSSGGFQTLSWNWNLLANYVVTRYSFFKYGPSKYRFNVKLLRKKLLKTPPAKMSVDKRN